MDAGRTTGVYQDQNGNRLVISGAGTLLKEAGAITQTVGEFAAIATVATPATGSCGVQFTFSDCCGNVLSAIQAGKLYVSNSAGALATAVTSLAVLTNGGLATLVTGQVAHFVTTAAGLLGVTLTMTTGTYYLSFVLPSGKVLTSSALVCN